MILISISWEEYKTIANEVEDISDCFPSHFFYFQVQSPRSQDPLGSQYELTYKGRFVT